MNTPHCLAFTGSSIPIALIIAAVALVVGGGILVFFNRRKAAKALPFLLLVPFLVGGLLLIQTPAPAQAAVSTANACRTTSTPTSSATAVSDPTTTTTPTPTATPTPTPTAVVCPAGDDVSTLPAGESVVWVPVIAPDPRDEPGQPGEYVTVYDNNISGYTWHILRSADGATSADCGGQPNNAGTCVENAQVSGTGYVWIVSVDGDGSWQPSGGFGGNNGCSGSGGNS